MKTKRTHTVLFLSFFFFRFTYVLHRNGHQHPQRLHFTQPEETERNRLQDSSRHKADEFFVFCSLSLRWCYFHPPQVVCLNTCPVPTTWGRLWSGLATLWQPGPFPRCPLPSSACSLLDLELTTITGATDTLEEKKRPKAPRLFVSDYFCFSPRFYKKKFKEYPKSRKALIPFIFWGKESNPGFIFWTWMEKESCTEKRFKWMHSNILTCINNWI